jgi:predicted ribosome quality control (RQC) complex YloA/Tae2 family protein
MLRITLDINKSIEQNASLYYDKAKKIKKKIEGAKEALEETKKKIKKLEKEKAKEEKEQIKVIKTKKEWYEKFRWCVSSEGFLVIGGRDATTNEIVVKKHTDKDDLVFHTDMIGSPFFVIKANNKKITPKTIKETADATVTFSRAWKLGLQNSSVFYCKPEQLTKEAPSGEYVPRGGFVTKGKLNYIENNVNCAIGLYKDKIMAGPLEPIKKNCEKYIEIEQGKEKASSIAKYIQKKIGGNLDDIIRVLPSGGCKIKK